MKKQPDSLYYTPIEAAAALSVDRRTIYNWIRSNSLKAIRFGKSWRIPRTEIERGRPPSN